LETAVAAVVEQVVAVNRFKTIQFGLEYAGLRVAVGLFRRLPLRISLGLAQAAADVAYGSIRSRRRIAVRNVLHTGMRDTPAEASALARESFRHLARSAVESTCFSQLFAAGEWKDRVTFDSDAASSYFRDRPPEGGLILACGHFGNAEVAGMVLSKYKPLVGIARPLTNPWVDRYVNRERFGGDFESIPKHGADMHRFLDILKEGKALALMIDQHAGTRGTLLPFLGKLASTHAAIALLALITKTPVYFGYCRRTTPLRFECGLRGPISCERSGTKQEDIARILLGLNGHLEACIRESPEQYLWAHRRWRPQDVDPTIEPGL